MDVANQKNTVVDGEVKEVAESVVKQQEKSSINEIVVFAVVFLAVIFGAFLLFGQYKKLKISENVAVDKKTIAQNEVAPTAAPTLPPRPLMTGERMYTFTHGKDVKGPKLGEVTLTPVDPKMGEVQHVKATVKHDSPVTSAAVNLQTDNETVKYPLTLTAGTATDGTWEGEWTIKDTYSINYYVQFDLKSATSNYLDGLRLR